MKIALRNYLMMSLLISIMGCQISARELSSYEDFVPINPISLSLENGSLILSNSPETIKKPGILYEDQMIGDGRIVYHHVNATGSKDVQLVIWLENKESSSCIVTCGAKGKKGPAWNYLQAGEMALMEYFLNQKQEGYVLASGEKHILYCSADEGWPVGTLLTGMMDFSVSGSVKVYVAVEPIDGQKEPKEAMIFLEKGIEERGKFNTLTIAQYVTLPPKGKFYYLIEAGREDWQQGKDQITDEYAINYGNYGIMYKITIYASEETKVFISPRGGIFQGVIRWEDGRIFPVKRPHVFKLKKEVITIAKLEKGEKRTFEYMLPNGSAAPVLIGFEVNE